MNNRIQETWLPVPGFFDLFASKSGLIKRFDGRNKKWFVSPGIKNGDGYYSIKIKDGWKKVHRLVAMAFLDNPSNAPHINHINGIRWDNRCENLEWCTCSENRLHGLRIGLITPSRGSKHGMSVLNEREVEQIFLLVIKRHKTQGEVAKKFGVSASAVGLIVNRKNWLHLDLEALL